MTSQKRTRLTSTFVRHKPCPKCKSRDNLAEFSDGHEWCFGCGYYKPPEWSLDRARQKEEKGGADAGNYFGIDPGSCDTLPEDAYKWLKKYGITEEEVVRYDVGYDRKRDLLCFPLKEESGRIAAYTCRNFGPDRDKRKTLTFGSLSHPVIIASPEAAKNIGVFVEDIISAIKVGRSFEAYPVLGSNIPLESLRWAQKRLLGPSGYHPSLEGIPEPPGVGIWLDRDMHGKAHRFSRRLNAVAGFDLGFPVFTHKDPKEYGTEEIKKIVRKARNFF
jgi:hypothetical protein